MISRGSTRPRPVLGSIDVLIDELARIHPSIPAPEKQDPPLRTAGAGAPLASNINMSTATTYSTNSATKPSSSSATSYRHHHHQLPTTQACAACKYQRRKCSPGCPLAPYFPADQHRQFLNAHRLFGVSNILKIIRNLDAQRRNEAMRSIIFQSNARAHDPVGGCYRVIFELQRQIEHFSAELSLVLRQIELCRSQAAAEAANSSIPPDLLLAPADDVDPASYTHFTEAPDVQQQPTQSQMQYCNYFYFDGGGGGDENENNHNHENNNGNENQIHVLDLEVVPESMFALHPPQQKCQEEDLKPLVDMFEIRQAFAMDDEEVNSKDAAAFHSSSKTEHKEEQNPMEHVQEHDLKGAASLFTLTNCNASSV